MLFTESCTTNCKLYFPYFMTDFYKILYKMSSRNATVTEGGCHENRPILSRTFHRAVNIYIYVYSTFIAQVGATRFSRSARNTAEQERHCTIGRHGRPYFKVTASRVPLHVGVYWETV